MQCITEIPRFYFPGKKNCVFNQPVAQDAFTPSKELQIRTFFTNHKQTSPQFWKQLTTELLNWPKLLEIYVYRSYSTKLYTSARTAHFFISSLLTLWETEIAPFDKQERLFRLLTFTKQDHQKYLEPDDLVPLIEKVVEQFGNNDQQFINLHNKHQYIQSVIARFFYWVNRSRTGKITLREFRLYSELEDVLKKLETVASINDETKYFSYLQFNILFHLFQSFPQGKMKCNDLCNYYDHAINTIVINRIYKVGQRACSDGKMGFHKKPDSGLGFMDFIYFFLSDIDKSSKVALKYWFDCLDVDGDGILKLSIVGSICKCQFKRLTLLEKGDLKPAEWTVVYLLDRMKCKNRKEGIVLDDWILTPERRAEGEYFIDTISNLWHLHRRNEELEKTGLIKQKKMKQSSKSNQLSCYEQIAKTVYLHKETNKRIWMYFPRSPLKIYREEE